MIQTPLKLKIDQIVVNTIEIYMRKPRMSVKISRLHVAKNVCQNPGDIY